MTARPRLSFGPSARVWRLVALAITIASSLAIVATYFAFSNTYDEPAHIAAGVEWLSGHRDYDALKPPLGRIVAGLGPYLHHDRPSTAPSPTEEGARVLGRGAHYRVTLALARLGELPFFLLLCAIAWAWGRRVTDERGGAIAVLLTAANPNILAHAALATSDIALAATLASAVYAFDRLLEQPHFGWGLALGTSLALALTTGYAAIGMLTLALPAIYVARRHVAGSVLWADAERRRKAVAVAVTLAAAIIVGWSVYGFNVGPLVDGWPILVPAPGWLHGLVGYLTGNGPTRPAFLFNERSGNGWWYYHLVALLVKTPLPLLLFATLGASAATRDFVRRKSTAAAVPLIAAIAIVLAAMLSGDDSGVRVVLPIYSLLAVLGAVAAVELWTSSAVRAPIRRLVRVTVVVTLAAALLVPIRAQPDNLAYFNPIAGDHPERILVDSNLDWGQDLYRLSAVVRRMRIDSVAVAYYGSASLDAAGVRNGRLLSAAERPTGWIAASQTMLAGVSGDGAYEWLNELQPVGRVGASLVLYYVPPRRHRR